MTKLTKKLFISLLAVAFAIVALGTTTYAWLAVSSTATISTFDGQVKAADSSLEIKVVDTSVTEWTGIIDSATIEGLYANSFTAFSDITSANGRVFNIRTTDGSSTTAPTSSYIEFSFLVKASGNVGNLNVAIDLAATTLTSGGTWTADRTFINSLGTEVESGTSYNVTAADAARMSLTSGSTTVVVENSQTGLNTTGFGANLEQGALHYFNIINAANPSAQITSTQLAAGIAAQPQTSKLGAGTVQLLTLNGEEEATVTVRVWIEGWDAECLNAIYSDTLAATIQLVAVR